MGQGTVAGQVPFTHTTSIQFAPAPVEILLDGSPQKQGNELSGTSASSRYPFRLVLKALEALDTQSTIRTETSKEDGDIV